VSARIAAAVAGRLVLVLVLAVLLLVLASTHKVARDGANRGSEERVAYPAVAATRRRGGAEEAAVLVAIVAVL